MYEFLSTLAGVPVDQIRFVCHLFYIFPIGYANRFIKDVQQRLIFGLITGLLLCYSMYGYTIYHLIIDTLFTHYFITWFGRKYSSFFIMLFTLAHISYCHIERMYLDYGGWSMDVTGIYMMSVVKFSAMGFSYEDGAKEDSEILSSHMRMK